MSEQIGVGIVGTGTMARRYARIVESDPRARVVGWATRGGVSPDDAPAYRTVEELLAAGDRADVVIVATPDFAHREASVAAALAGRHVLIEKPLAMSGEDAEAILAATRETGVRGMTVFNQRWHPAYFAAKRELSAPDAGRAVMAYARKNDTIFVSTELIAWADRSSPSWFLSSHDVDLVRWLIGQEAVEVYASAARGILTARGIDSVDAVQAQVRFDGGAIATFESSWTVPNGYPTVVESFVEVQTTDRMVHVDRKVELLEVADEAKTRYPRTADADIAGRTVGPLTSAVTHFLDVVEGRAEQLIPLEDSVKVTWLLEAIETSYTEGRPVALRDGRPV